MSDRKYRQRGYQDDEPRERSRSTPSSPREGPRGRGLGAPTRSVFRCHDCGTAASRVDVSPGDSCTVVVTFDGQGGNQKSGTLTAPHNGVGSPATLALAGQ